MWDKDRKVFREKQKEKINIKQKQGGESGTWFKVAQKYKGRLGLELPIGLFEN